MLEFLARITERLPVAPRLPVCRLYALSIGAIFMVVMNVPLARLLFGFRVVRGSVGHFIALLKQSGAGGLLVKQATMSGAFVRPIPRPAI